jgi:hypothetical protein
MSSPVGVTGPVKCVNNPIFMVDGAAGAGGGVGVKVKKATLIPTAAIITIAAIIIENYFINYSPGSKPGGILISVSLIDAGHMIFGLNSLAFSSQNN